MTDRKSLERWIGIFLSRVIVPMLCVSFFLSFNFGDCVAQDSGTDAPLDVVFAPTLNLVPKITPSGENRRLLSVALVLEGELQLRRGADHVALRAFQRAFRLIPSAQSLESILRLTMKMKLKEEFFRYVVAGSEMRVSDAKLVLQAAMLLTENKKYLAAIGYYRNWLHLNRENPNTYFVNLIRLEMGRLLYLKDDYVAASDLFRLVLDALSDDGGLSQQERNQLLRNAVVTYRMMGNSLIQSGDVDLAEQLLRKTWSVTSKSTVLKDEATLLLARGDLDQAEKKLLQSIAKQSNDSEAFQLLERILLKKFKEKNRVVIEMINILESVRKRFQTGKVVDDQLVRFYRERDLWPNAIAILENQRAGLLWQDEANRKLLGIRLLQNDGSKFLEAMAIELKKRGSVDAIGEVLQRAVSKPELMLDIEKFQSAQPEALVQRFCRDLMVMLSNPKKAKWLRPAVEAHLESISIPSLKRKLVNCWAEECRRAGQYAVAIPAFKLCLDLNRSSNDQWVDSKLAFESLISLAMCSVHLGLFETADEYLNQARDFRIGTAALDHLDAWTELQKGCFFEAIEAYRDLIQKYDSPGKSSGPGQMIELAKLELGLAFSIVNRPFLAGEIVAEVFDSKPQGPNLTVFEKNNRKYAKEINEFREKLIGAQNGGPLTLGRD